MKTIRRLFSVIFFLALIYGFSNLTPSNHRLVSKTTHIEAVSAPKKTKTHMVSSEPLKPPDLKAVTPDKAIKTETPTAKPVPITRALNHDELLQAAGIGAANWPAAEQLIMIESSWNWWEVEPTTGACGLQQENPCGKSGCAPSAQVCGLRWANEYVVSRYGNWQLALDFHLANGWY